MRSSSPRLVKRPLFVVAASLALIAILPLSASASDLATEVALLVGSPAADGSREQGVLVVPGAVIPVTSDVRWDSGSSEIAAVQRLQKIADDLERSLRLDDLEVRYRMPLYLDVDERRELPPPAGSSNIRLIIKLLGFNDDRASYDVEIYDGERQITHTPLSIQRGKQAVVGGLDGEEAPYLFVVLAPAAAIKAGDPLPSGPVPVSGDIQPPLAIDKLRAEYTPEALEKRIQGVVIMRVVIDEDGFVGDVKVLKGLPLGLTDSAVEAIKQWRFEPALLDSQPISVYYNLTISFRLD